MTSELGFGIVGAGMIGPTHAKAIQAADGAKLVAVADLNEERGRAFAQKFNCQWHASAEEMFARRDIDVVTLCVPSGLHLRLGAQAAQAGKHVVTEKPLAVDVTQSMQLIEACRFAGVQLAGIFNRRYLPGAMTVKKAIENGALGRLLVGDFYGKSFRSQDYYDASGWRGTWAMDGGGAMMNQGVHLVDQLQWVMGPVAEVFAYSDHLSRKIEADDTTVGVVRFSSGALGVMESCTSINPRLKDRMEYHGEKGTILMEHYTVVRCIIPDNPALADAILADGGQEMDTAVGHNRQFVEIVKALRGGTPPPIAGPEAVKAVGIIEALYKSARLHAPVPLAEGRPR